VVLDADELIRLAELELADGNPSARKTVERAQHELLKQRDAKGLESLLSLASRLEDGGKLTNAIQQNLRWLNRHPPAQIPPTIESSRLERAAGPALFLGVTACWMFGLLSAELNWIGYADFFLLIATGFSVVSVVLTGYYGRLQDALWLGWIPGAAMMAIGFSLSPEPGGDETGGGLNFVGGLVLFGWAVYFFPLIALGVWLRTRAKRPPPDPPAGWIQPRLTD
jgi:hypothetical protein